MTQNIHECFSNDLICFDFLEENQIFYRRLKCPLCEAEMIRDLSQGYFRCPAHNCRKALSLRYGTFFYGSHLSSNRILLIAHEWAYKTPASYLCRKYNFSKKTITAFYQHLRILVGSTIEEERSIIGGENIVVEIDECKMGKRKYHRGHSVEGVWIFGGVERENTDNVFFVKVDNRNKETLQRLILENIKRGSIICSDMWRAYIGLNDLGYVHNTVNHSFHFRDPDTGTHTNTIEGTWNGLKLQIPPRNRTKTIDAALLEAIWRKQNRNNLWEGLLKCLRNVHYELIPN
jgi:IS1 family transposase